MSEFLDYILRTNLYNFVIFAGIITFLCIKLDVIGGIEQSKNSVKENVEASENAKKESEENLSEIESKVSNLENEINEIISKSTDNAKLVGNQILNDANRTVENIKDNSKKLVENKITTLKNDILKRASLASVEVAKNHIINELNNNYDLHERLIEESLQTLDNVEAG